MSGPRMEFFNQQREMTFADYNPYVTRWLMRKDVYLDILPVIVFTLQISNRRTTSQDFELTLHEMYFDLTCNTLGEVPKSRIPASFLIKGRDFV